MKPRTLRTGLLFFALARTGDAMAGGLVIVDYAELDRYWKAEPALVTMEVGTKHEDAYGCVTVGFMIDRGGNMAAVRPLRRAFGERVPPRRARELTIAVTNASPLLGRYSPVAENPNRTEVFTALTIPVFGRKLSAGMDLAQKEAVAARLRPSCEIEDLSAWIDSHDMRKEPEVEAAPALEFGPSNGVK
jgi:hypothetical protein